MRVLVTGGAGFIGSHLVEALVRAGHTVFVVDNLSRGAAAHLPPGIPLFVTDIRDPAVEDLLREVRPAVIHHLAAQVDVAAAVADPLHDAEVNLLGTIRLLQVAVRAGVDRVVVASSAAVYGEPERLPVPEDHPLRPQSPYGLSKAAMEGYVQWFGRHHRLSWVILRYANVYGPRQPAIGEAGVVAQFVAALRAGRPPVIHGDGGQTRDFVFVTDVAAAHLWAMDGGMEGIYNIGTGQAVSVRALWERLRSLWGATVAPCHGPSRPGDIRHMVLDPRRAAERGWRARVSLAEGLARLVAETRHWEERGDRWEAEGDGPSASS